MSFVQRAEIDHTQANRKKDTNYLDNMGKQYDFTTMYTQINLIQLLNEKFLAENSRYLIAPDLLNELKKDLLNKISKEELLRIFKGDSIVLFNDNEVANLMNWMIKNVSKEIQKEQLSEFVDDIENIYYKRWENFDEVVNLLDSLSNKRVEPISQSKDFHDIDDGMHAVYGNDTYGFDDSTTQGEIGDALINLIELLREKEKCTMLEETNR